MQFNQLKETNDIFKFDTCKGVNCSCLQLSTENVEVSSCTNPALKFCSKLEYAIEEEVQSMQIWWISSNGKVETDPPVMTYSQNFLLSLSEEYTSLYNFHTLLESFDYLSVHVKADAVRDLLGILMSLSDNQHFLSANAPEIFNFIKFLIT